MITCIYCKERKPPSGEHAVARSLGGNLVIRCVCRNCNSGELSRIDRELAQNSFVAFSRVVATPTGAFKAQLGNEHFHYHEQTDAWVDVKVVNEFRTRMLPQIHIRPGQSGKQQVLLLAEVEEDRDALLDLVTGRIDSGKLADTHVKIGPEERCSTYRFVMHRSNDAYVRAKHEKGGRQLLQAIEQMWTEYEPAARSQGQLTHIPNPTIEVAAAIRFDDVLRAVAKTALNYLAYAKGAEFALQPEFDEIRDYIIGKSLVHPDPIPAGEVAIEGRFVHQLPYKADPMIPTSSHSIGLFYAGPTLVAFVTLYQDHTFIVELGECSLSEEIIAHEFSTDRTWNEVLELGELVRRIRERDRGKSPS